MGIIKAAGSRLTLTKYGRSIREAPREVIGNRNLLLSSLVYALAGVPMTWDQGASAVIPSLPGFERQFNVSSGSDADNIQTYVSIIYIGYAVGAVISFFINDYIGRRWAYRLYTGVWIVGQMAACFAPNMRGVLGTRIVSGIGIGSLSVIGPMSIVEIAPKEIRGLLTAWYTVAMGVALSIASFCVLGVYETVPISNLQYQIPLFAPAIFMFFCIVASFFISESPRWLLMRGERTEAVDCLVKLRHMPADHPRVASEISDIEASISGQGQGSSGGNLNLRSIVKETFTVPSNLRRLQQVLVSYALAQLSGANSVTSYFVPIMALLGDTGGTSKHIFLSGMYGFSKLWFSLFSSLFFIDVLGRRRSLFIGVAVQMVSHIYIGVFIKYQQEGPVSKTASGFAVGALFIHAFGYAVGLFILPYVFGSELWPNRIRSFGTAVGQTFHWLFIYAIKFAFPSLLESTHNWGAFIFFAGFCFLGFIYVFFMVPETAGLSVEEVDKIFEGPWLNAWRQRDRQASVDSSEDGASESQKPSNNQGVERSAAA